MWGRKRDELVQQQIEALHERVIAQQISLIEVKLSQLEERISGQFRLMDEKFVTLGTVMKYQADNVRLALDASQTAIDKSDVADEKARDRLAEDLENRFAAVNEFRSQQRDIIATFMPRAEFDLFRQQYTASHVQLREAHAEQISDLKSRMDRSEGKSVGTAGTWAAVVGVITLMVIIVNVIIYAFSNR